MVYLYSQTAEFAQSTTSVHSHQSGASSSSSTQSSNSRTDTNTNTNGDANMDASSSPDSTATYILSFTVPTEETAKVCARVCRQSGAGTFSAGLDTEAYWTVKGVGQFRAMDGYEPAPYQVGSKVSSGRLEKVDENKVEIVCQGRDVTERAVRALKKAHPYELVPYYVVRTEAF